MEKQSLERAERVSVISVNKGMECCPPADGKLAGLWEALMVAAPKLLHWVTLLSSNAQWLRTRGCEDRLLWEINGSKLIFHLLNT